MCNNIVIRLWRGEYALDDAKYIRIGAKIKYYRNIEGMDQTELSEKIGISRQYLSRLECGNSKPSVDLLFRISEVLGVDIALIMRNDDIDR